MLGCVFTTTESLNSQFPKFLHLKYGTLCITGNKDLGVCVCVSKYVYMSVEAVHISTSGLIPQETVHLALLRQSLTDLQFAS